MHYAPGSGYRGKVQTACIFHQPLYYLWTCSSLFTATEYDIQSPAVENKRIYICWLYWQEEVLKQNCLPCVSNNNSKGELLSYLSQIKNKFASIFFQISMDIRGGSYGNLLYQDLHVELWINVQHFADDIFKIIFMTEIYSPYQMPLREWFLIVPIDHCWQWATAGSKRAWHRIGTNLPAKPMMTQFTEACNVLSCNVGSITYLLDIVFWKHAGSLQCTFTGVRSSVDSPGPRFKIKKRWIPIIKIRWSWDRLIFIMRVPIREIRCIYTETVRGGRQLKRNKKRTVKPLIWATPNQKHINVFSLRLAFVFAQSIEAGCSVKNEDVFGAPTVAAPTTFEWSTTFLHTYIRGSAVYEIRQY